MKVASSIPASSQSPKAFGLRATVFSKSNFKWWNRPLWFNRKKKIEAGFVSQKMNGLINDKRAFLLFFVVHWPTATFWSVSSPSSTQTAHLLGALCNTLITIV